MAMVELPWGGPEVLQQAALVGEGEVEAEVAAVLPEGHLAQKLVAAGRLAWLLRLPLLHLQATSLLQQAWKRHLHAKSIKSLSCLGFGPRALSPSLQLTVPPERLLRQQHSGFLSRSTALGLSYVHCFLRMTSVAFRLNPYMVPSSSPPYPFGFLAGFDTD